MIMNISKSQFYISSISKDCIDLSKKYGFGIEATEYSYAENMDTFFDITKPKIDNYKNVSDRIIFHAPFYEMSMGAIDSKVTKITMDRFNQFYDIVKKYSPSKLVFHSGFLPNVYYREWFVDKAVLFLKEFIKDKNIEICLENVFSDEPSFIYDIVSKVNSDKLKICLDIGHINAYGDKACRNNVNECIKYWLDKLYPYISHFHIHNNNGIKDTHNDVYDGDIDIKDIIVYAISKIENPTFTVEVMNIKDFPDFIDTLATPQKLLSLRSS